jgi:anti-sigma factor RsiW
MNNTTDCSAFAALIERSLKNELDPSEHDLLARHLTTCSECRGDAEFLQRLTGSELLPEPSEMEMTRMRRNVVAQIGAGRKKERDVMVWFAAVAALALIFFGGILIGRNSGSSDVASQPVVQAASVQPAAAPASSHDGFARDIELVASRHQNIEDVENSPLAFSNMQVSEVGNGMVNLSFDVSRHMELTLPKRDPVVAEVLVQSLIQPENVGTKLKAISAAQDLPDSKVRSALIRTMATDANVAVRLKAQEKLVQYPNTAETEKALLDVLAHDESIQMRLVAIDYLTTHKVAPQLLRNVLAKSDAEGRNALYVRAGDYIQGDVQ